MTVKPWAEGPLELFKHAMQHLKLQSEFDNRIAMISIDNAIELMIRTYLSLPKRITCIKGPSRKEFSEISQSFPSLLDTLERFASNKIAGVELGDIEWYHRIRNQLYHDGNGVTVSKDRVQAYAEIGKGLFSALFQVPIDDSLEEEPVEMLSSFIRLWAELDHALIQLRNKTGLALARDVYRIPETLVSVGILPADFVAQFRELKTMRNEIVHGIEAPKSVALVEATRRINSLLSLVIESYNKLAANQQSQKEHWQGVEWNDKFLCYAGPLEALRLIEDRPFEHSMSVALSAVGFSVRIAVVNRLSSHAEKGYRVVYLTDRASWRQRITRGESILLARPDKHHADVENG